MVEISEIRDEKSLRAWLEALPRETEAEREEANRIAVVIAWRSAARMMPNMIAQQRKFARENSYLSLDTILIFSLLAANDFRPGAANLKRAEYLLRFANEQAGDVSIHTMSVFGALSFVVGTIREDANLRGLAVEAVSAAERQAPRPENYTDIYDVLRRDVERLVTSASLGAIWPDEFGKVRDFRFKGGLGEDSDEAKELLQAFYEMLGSDRGWKAAQSFMQEVVEISEETWGVKDKALRAVQGKFWKYQIRDNPSVVRSEIERLVANLSDARERERTLRDELRNLSEKMDDATTRLRQMADDSERLRKDTDAWQQTLKNEFDEKIEAAEAALREKASIAEPVKLWNDKQEEHEANREMAFRWYLVGLWTLVVFVLAGLVILALEIELITRLFFPQGCESQDEQEICSGFTFQGLLVSGAILTLFTVILWFTRIKMKEYLSERHLALDARERRAFAQSYIGFLAAGDGRVDQGEGSDSSADQRAAIVYAALFRPSTDGIVKDEGGLDPSIAAAISKLLSK